MAALLVMMSVMAVALGAALPVWNTAVTREREAELIFRGEQYARAVMLFQRRYANALPPNVDVLVNERFLRKRYLDPMTGEDFQVVGPGTPLPGLPDTEEPEGRGGVGAGRGGAAAGRGGPAGQQGGRGGQANIVRPAPGASAGVLGVVSRSSARSLRLYNGRDRYDQWVFLATEMTQTPGGGVPGAPVPGDGPGGAQPGSGMTPGGRGQGGGRGGVGGFGGGRGTGPGGRGGPATGGGRGVPPPGGAGQ